MIDKCPAPPPGKSGDPETRADYGKNPPRQHRFFTLAELFAGQQSVIPNVNPAMFKAAPVEAKEQGKLF